MKKVMYLLGLLFLCSFDVMALPIPKQINASSGDGHLDVTAQICSYSESYAIHITNLPEILGVTCHENSFINAYLPFPANYPPMLMRTQLNGRIDTIIVDTLIRVSCAMIGQPSVYGFGTRMGMGFSSQCMKDDPNPDPIPIFVSSEILTWDGNGNLVPYPICNYTSGDDIFSCEYFEETSPFCDYRVGNDKEVCENEELYRYTKSTYLSCDRCQAIEIEGEGDHPKDTIITPPNTYSFSGGLEEQVVEATFSNSITNKDVQLKVNPNPFTDKINVQWFNATERPVIKLYNTSGQLMKSWSSSDDQGNNQLEWDTSDLPKGMYIIQLKSGTSSKHLKLIKS